MYVSVPSNQTGIYFKSPNTSYMNFPYLEVFEATYFISKCQGFHPDDICLNKLSIIKNI